MNKNYIWLFLAFFGMIACESDDDGTDTIMEEPITAGTADFSNFIAIGNSLTAGYTDGALFIAGQQNSMPSIMAAQFALAGGGSFIQPLMADNTGGVLINGTQILENRLFFNGAGPQRLPGSPSTDVFNVLTGPFNNMGVPGSKSYHLGAPGYGNVSGVLANTANPYFVRFASTPDATIIADALAQNPSFFSLWTGNNDVLGYATAGGTGVDRTGDINVAAYGSNDITDPGVFGQIYAGYITALTANGAGGVVANVPDVSTIPYFTTVPFNPVPVDAATAGQLNAQLLGPVMGILTQLGEGDRLMLLSSSEPNPLLITDKTLFDYGQQISGALQQNGVPQEQAELMGALYGRARHATATDLITLPTSSIIGGTQPGIPAPFNTIGVTYPLEDQNVLLLSEQIAVTTAIDAYNVIIKSQADAAGLAFVDANALLKAIGTTGITFDEFNLNGSLVFGNAFSLDGVHPTARGYAFIANQFMDAINTTYGSNLPAVKAGDYNTVYPVTLQ
ncbi:G-D-S-L family lipolytic protein [Ascidiimonas sp. W6]|uniref:G-D-S-L family lipolytic protein n=1 Tax=Ascidiimonas meishanensis TaxID=3128903 RepID=UPI0030EC880B